MTQIVYESTCETCDTCKTNLGIISSMKKGIFNDGELKDLSEQSKVELVKMEYEQFCLDKRTEMIQGFKKKNIENIHKEVKNGGN